jgi:hypothetical protein
MKDISDVARAKGIEPTAKALREAIERAPVVGGHNNSSHDHASEERDFEIPERPWPVMDPKAFYGLFGRIVRLIEPETEADPAAILAQLLAAFGNVIGRNPFFHVEAAKHHSNLFLCIVGRSAKGRKGTRVLESWRLA